MLANRFAYIGATEFGNDVRHPELLEYEPLYTLIRDCLDNRVKHKGKLYLPDPSEGIIDERLKELRYNSYLQRACFVPITKRTRDGLVAQVFIRKPSITGEDSKGILERITTKGTSLTSLANVATGENVACGRGAFHVTYSVGAQRPFIDLVQPEDIITWAETPYGEVDDLGRNVASATIRAFFNVQDSDGISIKKVAMLVQYSLDRNGIVWVRRKVSGTAGSALTGWTNYEMVRINGSVLRHVPVFPFGAEENLFDIQSPPLGEMAMLNISHYINSADYEEFAKMAGQVTPVFSGLKSDWYTKHIENKVMFGMRTPVGLNEGATAQLLQAQPNSVAKEALDKKEAQMVAIGARLIEERKVRKTATEASLEDQSYHSILGHLAYNVSTALSSALNLFGRYYNLTTGTLSIALNSDFTTVSNDSEHRRLLLEEYIAGVRTFEEYRTALRNYDSNIQVDDENAKKIILSEAKSFKKVLAESTMLPKQQNTPKGDNRTKTNPNKED